MQFKTHTVNIGNVLIGAENPVVIQSMVDVPTHKTQELLEQIERMAEAGAELIRISVPTIADVKRVNELKKQRSAKSQKVPLVADTHYSPLVATAAVDVFEKIRINPGNYIDRPFSDQHIYTDSEYLEELKRIRQRFVPFLDECKRKNVAIRIGANHGSLSGRIISRYGNTIEGLTESVMEFLRIADEENFDQIIISLKSSNTRIMIAAYRLLVEKMKDENMTFPLHLGVTEAGAGEDGRIKSAIGIGTLLLQGIGDTIRVSLTESPENEMPVAQQIIDHTKHIIEKTQNINQIHYSTKAKGILGMGVPTAILSVAENEIFNENFLSKCGYQFNSSTQKWDRSTLSPDAFYVTKPEQIHCNTKHLHIFIPEAKTTNKANNWLEIRKLNTKWDKLDENIKYYSAELNELLNISDDFIRQFSKNNIIFIEYKSNDFNPKIRRLRLRFDQLDVFPAIIFKKQEQKLHENNYIVQSSVDFGGLFVDNIGNGLCFETPLSQKNNRLSTIFGILQAAGVRSSKTDFIACPGCGRTLFDLQSTYKQVTSATSHLVGLKIAVMGCIVNGLGEMADADYAYVGAVAGKINLYKNKILIKKNLEPSLAVYELVQLIKADGKWILP